MDDLKRAREEIEQAQKAIKNLRDAIGELVGDAKTVGDENTRTITRQEAAKVLLADNLDFLTTRHKDNACLSYDHSFWLMSEEKQDRLRFQVKEWFRATLRAIAEDKA